MAQSPAKLTSADSLEDYLKNWDALSSMLTRGRSFSGRERNCAFLNLGSEDGLLKRFADVSAVSGLDFIDDGRAVIATDWDQDGDLDFWQTNREGPRLRFVRNQLNDRSKNQWIAFELTGTSVNRDAIGAVLELQQEGKKITRTLTAGDGFMSQSGKRIHFGLGRVNGSSTSVTIRWPGAAPETFENLKPGTAYQLTQGSGTARLIEKKMEPIERPVSESIPIPGTEQARTFLTQRIASPSFDYVDFLGELQSHKPDTGGSAKPVLINLWASWCPNCLEELEEFKTRHDALEAKGLNILALSVEGIPQGDGLPDLSGAKELIAKSEFPFKVGVTSQRGLRLLTVLHNRVIIRQRPLPLPSSFLLDRSGQLAAIYKGPVSADQLIADLELLEADAKTIQSKSLPFPGLDGGTLFPTGPLDYAKAYFAGGDADSARQEAKKMIAAPITGNAEVDLARRAEAWYFLGTLEQSRRNWNAAAEAYQSALDFSPGQTILYIPLGVSLWQSGKKEEAKKFFSQSATKGKGNVALLVALGKAHLQIKEYAQAITYFEEAITVAPNQADLPLNLALAHQTGGHAEEAAKIYRTFLKKHPDSVNTKNNLALLLATTPNDSVRDGREALRLAREVIAKAGEGHPSPLDSLSAALAETGEFEKAAITAQKAIAAARAIGRNDLVKKLIQKKNLYQKDKPFHSGN